MKSRIFHLDLLRTVCILFICAVWHLDDYAGYILDPRYPSEFLVFATLNIFVFISAYLVSEKDGFSAPPFLSKRIAHIYPLYILAIVVFYFLYIQDHDLKLISQITAANMLTGHSFHTLWFIGMLFNYYALLCIVLTKYNVRKTVMVFAAALTLMAFESVDRRLFLYLPALFAGVLYAKHGLIRTILSSKYTSLTCSTVIIMTVALFGRSFLVWDDMIGWPSGVRWFLFLAGFLSVFPAVSVAGSLAYRLPEKFRLMISAMAYASLALYLFHRPVYALLVSIYHPASDSLTVIYLWVVGVPLALAISYYMQTGYDLLLKRVTPGPSSVSEVRSHN